MTKRTRVGRAEALAATSRPSTSAAPAPVAERLISDVETLKALSDPLRLRILETMVTRADVPWSVKELAARLDVPQTRLYHHIELLVERDLLRVAEQRVVSGIIETRYQISALSLRLDPALVRGEGVGQTAAREVITTIFDETRRDLERILATPPTSDESPIDRTHLARSLARLTPARALELRERMGALLAEYDQPSVDPDATTYHLLVVMYTDPASKEASHGWPGMFPAAMGNRAVLRLPEFRKLFVAQSISDIGDGMTFMALMLLVDELTHSPAALAVLSIAVAIPSMVGGVFAPGAYADRLDRRQPLIVSDTARAILVLLFVVVGTLERLPVLYAVAFLQAAIGTFFSPARGPSSRGSSRRTA